MKTIIIVLMLLFVTAGAAGAQDNPQPERPRAGAIRAIIQIVAQETGLEPSDILTYLQQGQTLADIIAANGGSVDEVVPQAVAALTEQINAALSQGQITQEQADRLLNNLETVVTRGINGDLFPNRPDRSAVRRASERVLLQATAEATGLHPMQVLRQLREGSTLADIITANGASIDSVVDTAVAEATTRINQAVTDGRMTQERAAELLGSLEQVYTDAVNGSLRQELLERRVGLGVLRLAAEQIGMQPRDLIDQLRSGQTLANILTTNNIDVNAFVDSAVTQAQGRLSQAVENGRITQERADELTEQFRDRLLEWLNQTEPVEGAGSSG